MLQRRKGRHQRLETGGRPIVAVAGCVAQQEGSQILKRSRAVDVIIGTQNLKRLPMLVDSAVHAPKKQAPLVDLDPLGDAEPERRGINSIQLFRHPDEGWRIISMIWDNER